MRSLKSIKTGIALMMTLAFFQVQAQTYTLQNESSELTVFGTSNIHDWEIDVEKQSGSLTLNKDAELELAALEIEIEAESMKSGKSGMDKNTYKAMNTSKFPGIRFRLAGPAEISKTADNTYKVKVPGDLTISGVTKATDLEFELKDNGNTVELTGEKLLNMTEYNIEPPTALMGTIKTGEEVTLKFKTILNQ